jgi:hypothetical protein
VLIGAESAETSPGRSVPSTVRMKVAISAGYETEAFSVTAWLARITRLGD